MAWSLTEDPIRAEESSCANVMSAELRAVMQHELVGRARGEPVGGDGQHDGTVRPCAQGPTERAVEGPVEADVRFSTFTTDILTQRAVYQKRKSPCRLSALVRCRRSLHRLCHDPGGMVPTSDIDAASFNTSDTPDAPDNLHLSIVGGRGARRFSFAASTA